MPLHCIELQPKCQILYQSCWSNWFSRIIHFHRFFCLQEKKTSELEAVRSSSPKLEETFSNMSLKVPGRFLQKPRLFLFVCMLLLLIFFSFQWGWFCLFFVVLFPYLFVSLFACLFQLFLVSSLAKLNGRKRRDQWKEVPCPYQKRGVIHYLYGNTNPHHKRSVDLFFYFFVFIG